MLLISKSDFKNFFSSNIVEVKEIFGAYTMDTILQVAFGSRVDYLVEKDNKLASMAKKMFSTDFNLKTLFSTVLIFTMPRLVKLLGIRNEVMDFFKDFSLKIIQSKREELKKEENLGKANNFLELLLEAEAENAKLMEQESGKSVKCEYRLFLIPLFRIKLLN